MMHAIFLRLGALAAFTGVALGAFGAHGLKSLLSPAMLEVYKTGVTYQMWHALGLLVIAFIQQQAPTSKIVHWAGWLMFSGIVLFSGSLYCLAILEIRWLGMITPFGGLAFLSAWLLIGVFTFKKPDDSVVQK
jgi:uncharacterized membrane protein YgdD (TMEM256/DUF423 family)